MKHTKHDNVVSQYDSVMNHNFLVRYLHSIRYRKVQKLFRKLQQAEGEVQIRILDIGCANAKLFAVLNSDFNIKYTGIEPSKDFVGAAKSMYGNYGNFEVLQASILDKLEVLQEKDVVVALETFEHIEEHQVVRLVEAIAKARPKYLVCSVPVEIGPAIWIKNVGSFLFGYSRHQEYTWKDTLWAGLYQLDKLEQHTNRHKGFDWRWLAQTIRHNLKIVQTNKFPLSCLPAAFAFSIYFIAEPRE